MKRFLVNLILIVGYLNMSAYTDVALSQVAVNFSSDSTRISNITVGGQSILGVPVNTGGVYLIGSVDGSDNNGKSVLSIGGSGGLMKADPGVPRPPFKLTFTPSGYGRMQFNAEVGPVPTDFVTMSMPFDFSKAIIDSFKFNGSSYRVECSTSDGTRTGSGATYDSIVPKCVIPNTGGQKVSVAVVDGPITWGEVTGALATARINVYNSSHYTSLRFHNHFGTDNLEISFGRMRKGETAKVSGEIVVTPKSWVFEAEKHLSHQIGRLDGDGWSVNVYDKPKWFMCYGPYTTTIASGSRTARFRLMLDNVIADNLKIITIDVYDAASNKVLNKLDIYRRNFNKAFTYQDFSLPFSATPGQQLEFRTFWHGYSYVRQDNVIVQ